MGTDVADDFARLLDRVRDTPADAARDGIAQRGLTRAKVDAKRLGYYPPNCYDDDGNLDYRSIPDHPWAGADDHAHDMLDAAHILIGRSEDERRERLARALGVLSSVELPTDDTVTDDTRDLFTRLETVRRRIHRLKDRFHCRDNDTDRAVGLAHLRAILDEWDTSGEDVLTFTLRHDLVRLNSQAVPRDHPGVKAWLAEQAEQAEQEAA